MKNISFVISGALLLTACSKTVKEIRETSPREISKLEKNIPSDFFEKEQIEKLLASHYPNHALAEMLSRALSPSVKETIRQAILKIDPQELKKMIQEVTNHRSQTSAKFLFHGENYQNNKSFLKNSLLSQEQLSNAPFSSEKLLAVSVFNHIKNAALTEILETYRNNASEISKIFSEQVAIELSDNSETVKAIELAASDARNPNDFIDALSKNTQYLEKIDKYFKHSNINESEQYTLVTAGVVAGGIYSSIKENASFKNFVREAKKVTNDLKSLKAKADQLIVLVKALDKHTQDTKKNAELLKEGLLGAKGDFAYSYQEVTNEVAKGHGLRSRNMINFLHINVLSGVNTGSGDNTSIFSKPVKINENINKSINAAVGISNNLASILNTTKTISETLGVKLPDSTLKVIDKANKVAAVANASTMIIKGFATGGALGAVAAIGATNMGGLGTALGGGGNDNSAEFARINQKLDEILQNQREMMRLQVETMKMVKDLALLVDGYHQEEMREIAGLRSLSLVNNEISRSIQNKSIRSCERLIEFRVSSPWKDQEIKFTSNFGINNVKIVRSGFFGNIQNIKDVRSLINAGEMNTFTNCQEGIAEAFGAEINKENPVLSIYNTYDAQDLLKFQDETYLPLLNALYSFNRSTNFNAIPLHIPASNFEGQQLKSQIMFEEIISGTDSSNYHLEELISAKSLERYLSRLLIVYPLLEMDKPTWNLSSQEIINSYLVQTESNPENIRSYYYLMKALKMVQSAIAQETILAGEPLLHDLHKNFRRQLFSTDSCTEVQKNLEGPSALICSVRANKLLMKNLMSYSLSFQMTSRIAEYEDAYRKKDRALLASFFNNVIDPKRINEELELQIIVKELPLEKYQLALPTPAELESQRISYSENLPKLLDMQNLIIEAIEKVDPEKVKDVDYLKLFFLNAN
jgi:hypothetical protein